MRVIPLVRRRGAVGILAAVTTALSPGLVSSPASSAPAPAGVPSVSTTTTHVALPTRSGSLDATVWVPTTSAPTRGGRWPLVVMPGTFAGDGISVASNAQALARRGYVTVTYLERGYGASVGDLDAGGPGDVADVQDAITWLLAHTPSDPARVGLVGMSYGGGIVLEAAAADSRVRAVAEITGWADLGRALYPNRTPATVTRQALYALALTAARPSPEVRQNFDDAIHNVNLQGNLAFAAVRSPVTYMAALAARHTPVMMSHEMNETVFPVDQSIDFFTAYSGGPKRLDLWPGDHGSQEASVALGIVGPGWQDSFRWMDAYVSGYDRSITAEPPVRVQPRSPDGPHALESYAAPSPTSTQRLYLSTATQWLGTRRTLQGAPGPGSQTVKEGVNWLVHTAAPLYTYLLEVVTGHPPTVPLALVDQSVSAIWQSDPLPAAVRLRGATPVHLTVTPTAATGTLVVHLLDVDPLGITGALVAHQPITFSGPPGQPRPLDLTVPYNAYDLPAGHRLGVVVTTSDPSYTSANPSGSAIGIGAMSWVDVGRR